jgi:hypothetical protein
MATYNTWIGRGSYTPHEVSGRVVAQPYKLENNMCALQCDAGYWANLATTDHLISPTDAPRDQRCAFDNCKKFDAAQSPKHCTECWDQPDMATYSLWLGKGSYLTTEISGRVLAQPFLLENNMCTLQCDTGYWSNLNSSSVLINMAEPAPDQRCSSDNCKTFDVTQQAKHC